MSQTTQKVTRRSVVRVGANAAWAVPAIAVVTSTPAFAAASQPAKLVFVTASATDGGLFAADSISLGVKNIGTEPTTAFSITLTMPANARATLANVPAGWTVSPAAGTQSQSFTLTPGAQINPGAQVNITGLKVQRYTQLLGLPGTWTPANEAYTLGVVANTTSGTGASTTIAVP